MNLCSPPSAASRSAPGPQHQVIGVAEHDIGAGRRAPVHSMRLHGRRVPTGMNAGVRDRAVRRCEKPSARGAVVAR